MNGVRSFLRHAAVLALLVVFAVALGASPASSRTSDVTNPKHFFWAPGQNPSGTVADSTANDLIYHGGNAGAGAIGVETTPAVYLVYWGPRVGGGLHDRRHRRKALLEQDAPDVSQLVLRRRRRERVGGRPDAVLPERAPRLDELRRRLGLRHEPDGTS